MTQQQQEMGAQKGIVMDGRDIGTVVFPDAELKIFMTADPVIRAQRRLNEMEGKGQQATLDEVLKNIEERDHIDRNREVAPLRQAPDAIVLDNSHMTVEEQMVWFDEIFSKVVSQ
jgi:cytidylate kinase